MSPWLSSFITTRGSTQIIHITAVLVRKLT